MSDNFTADAPSVVKPYDFGKATFFPFLNFKFSIKLAALYSVIVAVIVALIAFWIIPDFIAFSASMETVDEATDPLAALAPMFAFMGKLLVVGLLLWPVYASYLTAFHRKAIMNNDGGTIPMKFGGTELKVMLTQLVLSFIYMGIIIGVYLMWIIIFLVIAGTATASEGAAIVVGIITVLAGIVGSVFAWYLAVRFAAAVPLTVYRDKFVIGESWNATRKRGWWMILSYFVIGLIGMVASYIIQIILMFVVMAGLPFDQLENLESLPDDEVGNALFSIFTSPSVIIPLLVVVIIYMLIDTFVKMCNPGVGAYVTRDYTGGHDLEAISALYD